MFTAKKGQQKDVVTMMTEWRAKQKPTPPGYKPMYSFSFTEVKQIVSPPEKNPAEVLFGDVKALPFSEWAKAMGLSQNGKGKQ